MLMVGAVCAGIFFCPVSAMNDRGKESSIETLEEAITQEQEALAIRLGCAYRSYFNTQDIDPALRNDSRVQNAFLKAHPEICDVKVATSRAELLKLGIALMTQQENADAVRIEKAREEQVRSSSCSVHSFSQSIACARSVRSAPQEELPAFQSQLSCAYKPESFIMTQHTLGKHTLSEESQVRRTVLCNLPVGEPDYFDGDGFLQ